MCVSVTGVHHRASSRESIYSKSKMKQNKASKNFSTPFGRRRFLNMFTYLIFYVLYYICMSSSFHKDLYMMCVCLTVKVTAGKWLNIELHLPLNATCLVFSLTLVFRFFF